MIKVIDYRRDIASVSHFYWGDAHFLLGYFDDTRYIQDHRRIVRLECVQRKILKKCQGDVV